MMQPHSNESQVDLNDMTNLLKLLQENQDASGRGELVILELGVKVQYDLYEGHVGPVSFIKSTGDVKVVYSDEIEFALKNQVTQQIRDAIALLARLYLLQRLLEMGDEKITKIIKSRHMGVQ